MTGTDRESAMQQPTLGQIASTLERSGRMPSITSTGGRDGWTFDVDGEVVARGESYQQMLDGVLRWWRCEQSVSDE